MYTQLEIDLPPEDGSHDNPLGTIFPLGMYEQSDGQLNIIFNITVPKQSVLKETPKETQ